DALPIFNTFLLNFFGNKTIVISLAFNESHDTFINKDSNFCFVGVALLLPKIIQSTVLQFKRKHRPLNLKQSIRPQLPVIISEMAIGQNIPIIVFVKNANGFQKSFRTFFGSHRLILHKNLFLFSYAFKKNF